MNIDSVFGTFLIFVNFSIAAAMVYLDLKYYFSTTEDWRWIKLAYAFIGMFWAAFYLLYLAFFINSPRLAQLLTRFGITLTLGAMLSGAILRAGHGGKKNGKH